MASTSGKPLRIEIRALVAYYLTLTTFFAASFYPESRFWGINWWGYYPLEVRIGLFVIGCAFPLLVRSWANRRPDRQRDISDRTVTLVSIGLLLFAGVLFYLLGTRTHFLGDGYLLLSTISAEQSFIKFRNLGSMGLPRLIMGLLAGGAEARALLSYQITAVAAGLLFIGVLILSARKLVSANRDKLLFVFSLATGGWMLLFFGYVENYALFVVSVLSFGLGGLLISQGKLGQWWILLPQGLALFFHVFGAALFPATIYLLIAGSALGQHISHVKTSVKWATAGAVALVAAFLFYYFYTTDYFFRFAFVPLVTDPFTVDGYTLFSTNHLLDFACLLLMLFPGLPVAAAGLTSAPRANLWSSRESRFLMLATAGALGCAFLFDPKLGMPRDWDLFAFCGVPLGLLTTWQLVKSSANHSRYREALLLSVGLSILLLLPRVVSQVDPDRSIAVAKNYINLDKSKTSRARFLLAQYLDQHGQSAVREQLDRQWANDLAVNAQFHSANQIMTQGRYAEAYPILRRIVVLQPNLHQAWALLSDCYLQAAMYDSALYCLRVSDGLNPYNAGIQSDIGRTYYKLGNLNEAERYFRKALGIDSLITPALMGLALIHRDRGETDSYLSILLTMTKRPNAPPEFYYELINYYLEARRFDQASRALSEGITKGLDSGYVQDVLRRYPDLSLPSPP